MGAEENVVITPSSGTSLLASCSTSPRVKTVQWDVIIIVVVIVDNDTYYWVYLSSDHPFQVYDKVRRVLQSATIMTNKVKRNMRDVVIWNHTIVRFLADFCLDVKAERGNV